MYICIVKNINRTLTYTSACFIEHFLFIAYYYAMFRKRIFPAIFLTFSIFSAASFALLRNACTVQNDAVFLASAAGKTAVITDGNMTSVQKTELNELNDIQKNTQAFSKKNNAGAFILYIKNAASCVPHLKKAEFIGAITLFKPVFHFHCYISQTRTFSKNVYFRIVRLCGRITQFEN